MTKEEMNFNEIVKYYFNTPSEVIPYDFTENLVGKIVKPRFSDEKDRLMIIQQNEAAIFLANQTRGFTYQELYDKFIFLDNTLCGKIVPINRVKE